MKLYARLEKLFNRHKHTQTHTHTNTHREVRIVPGASGNAPLLVKRDLAVFCDYYRGPSEKMRVAGGWGWGWGWWKSWFL